MPCDPNILLRVLAEAEAGDGWMHWLGIAVAVGGGVLIAWLGYVAWRNKDDFRITVRRGRVGFHGRFPASRRADTASFLLNDVAPGGTIRVIGNWLPGRVLRITVQGRIPMGQSQRIRNFMKITLNG